MLQAFCIKNGISAEDLIHYAKYPDDERSKELDKIVQQSKKEFFEIAGCKNREIAHQKAGEFYAEYTKKCVAEFDKISKMPQADMKDVDALLVFTHGQQSIIEQTIKEANKDVFEIAEKKLADEKYPVSLLNLRFSVPLSNGIAQELGNLKIGDDASPDKMRDACKHAAIMNLTIDNFRKEFSSGKPAQEVFKGYTEEKYFEITTAPYGGDPRPELDNSMAEDATSYDMEVDVMLDKQHLSYGIEKAAPNPEEKLDEILLEADKSHKGSIRNRMQLTDSNVRFADMVKAAKNLKEMMASGAAPDQLEIGYRELQFAAGNYLEYKKNVDSSQPTNAGNRKHIAEEFFKFGGTQKLELQGRLAQMQEKEVSISGGQKAYDEMSKHQLEEKFASLASASQKKITGRGSEEFRKLETALKEHSTLIKNMNAGSKEKLLELQLNIKNLSEDYLKKKEGQSLNQNGKERYQLARDVKEHFTEEYCKLKYLDTIKANVKDMTENPQVTYFKKELPEKVMEMQLKNLDHAAFRTVYKDLNLNQAQMSTIEGIGSKAESFDDFKKQISENKGVKNKEEVLGNADIIYWSFKQDKADAPSRKALAEGMLQKATYPTADRASLEKFAKENNVPIKDSANDADYLKKVETIRQYKIKYALNVNYKDTKNSERWANALLSKPGLKAEEKAFIIEEINKPAGQREKLYDYALKEIANADLDAFHDKSIDELIEKYPQESYYRQLLWDKDTMFNEMDQAIRSGNYKVDETVYKQSKEFAKVANGNASTINTKINQFERNQSMVMDFSGKTMDQTFELIQKTQDESIRCFLVEQGSYTASWAEVESDLSLGMKKCQLDIAKDPNCIHDKFAEYSSKYWQQSRDTFEKMQRGELEPKKALVQILESSSKVMYFNSAKLSSSHLTKEAAINIFNPKNMESKLPDLKATLTEVMKNMTMDKLKDAVFADEIDKESIESNRLILGKHMQEKAAKAAEKEIAQKAPQKVNTQPQKQAGGDGGFHL